MKAKGQSEHPVEVKASARMGDPGNTDPDVLETSTCLTLRVP